LFLEFAKVEITLTPERLSDGTVSSGGHSFAVYKKLAGITSNQLASPSQERRAGGRPSMKRMLLRVAGLMVLLSAVGVVAAQADTHVSVQVGIGVPVAPVVVAPRVVPVAPVPYPAYGPYYGPAPYPGYVWQPGYYVGYRWVPGAWVPPHAHVYVAPRAAYGSAHAYHGHH
jgi:hypothetical protein